MTIAFTTQIICAILMLALLCWAIFEIKNGKDK